MPHVSGRPLDQRTFERIFQELIAILERARGKEQLATVIDELLTKTEKIMFAKRLTIILMLSGHVPQHRVADVLHVSPSTIARISLGMERGRYKTLISVSKKHHNELESVVWTLLTAGGIMPPRAGRKYWRSKGRNAFLEG